MIPRVKINVSEDTTRYFTTNVDFVPVVIMKTMAGEIGTREVVRSESEFISKFGKATIDTPTAYAIQTYLRTYSFIYVTRVAGSSAAYGSATIKVGTGDEAVNLIGLKTTSKTASLNGTELKLIYDDEAHKLFLTTVINSSTVTSVKETYNIKCTQDECDAICIGTYIVNNNIVIEDDHDWSD